MAAAGRLEAAAMTETVDALGVGTVAGEYSASVELPRDPMLARLFDEPQGFEFFQAVRLLEGLHPDRARVGGFADPSAEAVRFRSTNSVSFPPSEIESLEPRGSAPPRLTVSFFGLTGPQGVLPLVYSLYSRVRARLHDHAMRDFLGIFDHRMVSLLYRAWEKSRAAMAFERPRERGVPGAAAEGHRDWLTAHLHDFVGLGVAGLQGRLPIPDDTLLYYAGLLSLPSRPAVALEQLLADYFGVPVEVEQFVGAWYPLARAAQSALGAEGDISAQLGAGAVAGDEVWDQQGRVRIRIGPLTRAQYDRFLPGGDAHDPLRALTRFFCNDQLDVEIQLVLARDDVPGCRLGDDGAALPLGWCTWLRTAPLGRDPDDTLFTL
jgi:type VI secretion system protein ImpH